MFKIIKLEVPYHQKEQINNLLPQLDHHQVKHQLNKHQLINKLHKLNNQHHLQLQLNKNL